MNYESPLLTDFRLFLHLIDIKTCTRVLNRIEKIFINTDGLSVNA